MERGGTGTTANGNCLGTHETPNREAEKTDKNSKSVVKGAKGGSKFVRKERLVKGSDEKLGVKVGAKREGDAMETEDKVSEKKNMIEEGEPTHTH